MQNELQIRHPETPETIQTEADAQAARLVNEHLDDITKRANRVECRFINSFAAVGWMTLLCCLLTLFLFNWDTVRSQTLMLLVSISAWIVIITI